MQFNSHFSTQTSSSQKVVHDQLNQSHSKQLFSFAKSSRFSEPLQSCCQSPSYELGSTLNKRATNLGFGNKSDFTKKGDSSKPGPDRYQAMSVFDQDLTKKKGASFSLGRSEVKFRSFPFIKPTPGPGTYEQDDSDYHRRKIYSMGMRTLQSFMNQSNKQFPGPAHYNLKGIDGEGKYHLTKHEGSRATKFNPPSNDRFSQLYNIKPNPGPGTYTQESIQSEGKYTNSKLHSAQGGAFSKGVRPSWASKALLINPGPGYYKTISEFGDQEFPPMPGSTNHQTSKTQSQFYLSPGEKTVQNSSKVKDKNMSHSQISTQSQGSKTALTASNDPTELAKIYGQTGKNSHKKVVSLHQKSNNNSAKQQEQPQIEKNVKIDNQEGAANAQRELNGEKEKERNNQGEQNQQQGEKSEVKEEVDRKGQQNNDD